MGSKNKRQRKGAQAKKNKRQRRRAEVEAYRKMLPATEQTSVQGTSVRDENPGYSSRTRHETEGGKSRADGKPHAKKKSQAKRKCVHTMANLKAEWQSPPIQPTGQKRKSRPPSQSGDEAEELSRSNGERIGKKRKFQPTSHSGTEAEELSQGVRNIILENYSCSGEVSRANGKSKRKKKKAKGKETRVGEVTTSNAGPRAEGKWRNRKVPQYDKVDWSKQYRAVASVRKWISNPEGDPKELTVDNCKAYLRYHGLRISGTKALLVDRIKEHIKLKEGRSEIYDWSTFTIYCRGDVCKGDVIRFTHLPSERDCAKWVVERRRRNVAGRIVSESYGTKRHQHTFTVEVLWSTGLPHLPPMKQLLVKGRKLYKKEVFRQA